MKINGAGQSQLHAPTLALSRLATSAHSACLAHAHPHHYAGRSQVK